MNSLGILLWVLMGVLGSSEITWLPHSSNQLTQEELNPSSAQFEGGILDLSKGWGIARACTYDGAVTSCFVERDELVKYLDNYHESSAFTRTSTCASSLELYENIGYGGRVLYLSGRYSWINLNIFGFDKQTSSYRVGGCRASFNGSYAGAGTNYPGDTRAGSWASTMLSGWDNRISSVYIY